MTLVTPTAVASHFAAGPRPEHFVQFYESDAFLANVVADYAADGLKVGEPMVIVATEEHRAAFLAALRGRGVDVDGIVVLDARETLAAFLRDGIPQREAFQVHIGPLIEQAGAGAPRVRVYGEMVDLLWRDGNAAGAVRLEQMWNELVTRKPFSLLCAYPMANFRGASHAGPFDQVCAEHSTVAPTERYLGTDAHEIARLQQRAVALEHEVERRIRLERELRDFVENAAIALHWVSSDGTILWANDAELRLLGYERDEYIGRPIAEFHADGPVLDELLQRLTANEQVHNYEARLVAKDGSIRYVLITSNVLFEEGAFVHTRCFTRDITDRKRLEMERERTAARNAFLLAATTVLNSSLDLESRLRELTQLAVPQMADGCAVNLTADDGAFERVSTGDVGGQELRVPMSIGARIIGTITFYGRELSEDDELLARELGQRAAHAIENARLYRLAQEANRIKDEFLATLSHELRTPLTAILGWARIISLGGLDEVTLRSAVETIERSAQTQAALINDLLDVSRIVTGKLALHTAPIDLAGVVRGAIQTVQLAADARDVQIDVCARELLLVVGDPTRLQQIVWNLLANAIKFSPRGGRVSVTLDGVENAARIVVRDSGRGIVREFLPHVFEPFRQGDGSSTRSHGGLGLGLAIVKYLSELHGGSVRAESEGEGKGAAFTVMLPIAAA